MITLVVSQRHHKEQKVEKVEKRRRCRSRMVCLLLHIHRRTTRTQSAFGTRRQGNWLVVPYDNFFEVNLVFCHARAVLMIIIHIIFGIIWFLLSSPVSPFHHPLLEHLDRSSALLDSKRAYYTTTPEAQSVRRHTAPKPVTVSARRKKQASSLLGVPRSPVYMTEPTEAMACTSP